MSSLAIILAATVEEEHGSAAELLLPAWPELVAGIIAFALVFFFVRKWAWPAFNRSLEARQAAITGQLTEAEEAKNQAEKLRSDYERLIADARDQGNKVIEESRVTAEQMKGDIIAKAQAEAEALLAKAREEAGNEKARALNEARREVANLAIDLAEKVVQKSLDREAQLGLVESYIVDLEKA